MNVQPLSNDVALSTATFPKKVAPTSGDEGFVLASPAQRSTTDAKPANPASSAKVAEAVSQIAKFVSQTQSEISFSVDKESGIDVVKVIDSKTKDVIRQIPSEEVIAIAQALDKLQGLFVRDKV